MTRRRPPHLARFCSRPIDTQSDAEVLLLAGGKGSRLRNSGHPRLKGTAKVLVEIDAGGDSESMLSAAIRGFLSAGFNRIGLLTSDDVDAQGNNVESHALRTFANLADLKLFREREPLGTAGAVYAAMQHLVADTFVISPADTLFPYELLVDGLVAHSGGGHVMTWFVTTRPGSSAQNADRLVVEAGTGRLVVAAEGSADDLGCSEFLHTRATSAGVAVVQRRWFCELFEQYVLESEPRGPVDLYRDLVPWALRNKEEISVHDIGQPAPDLGTPERYFEYGCRRLTSGEATHAVSA